METVNDIETQVHHLQVPTERDENTNESNVFEIRVKMLNEQVFLVTTAPETTILRFRTQVAQVTQVPTHLQRLIYRGKLLKDDKDLLHYDVQNGHTIHLVARSVALALNESDSDRIRSERNESDPFLWQIVDPEAATETSQQTTETGTVSNSDHGTALNLAMLTERLERMNSSGTAQTAGSDMNGWNTDDSTVRRGPGISAQRWRTLAANEAESEMNLRRARDMQHILQGILTARSILSSVEGNRDTSQALECTASLTEPESEAIEDRPRQTWPRFFAGQWLDVQDTVSQWLEGTVVDISETQVLIHYHGWPSRWDEWINIDSERLATFRSHTSHRLNAHTMSPTPFTLATNVPSIGQNDIRVILPQLRDLLRDVMGHVDTLSQAFEAEGDGADQINITNLAHLVAPLFDRIGRVLVDSSRHLEPLYAQESSGTTHTRASHQRRNRNPISGGTSAWMEASNAAINVASQPIIARSPDQILLSQMRGLIRTSALSDMDTRPRSNIDVHIHAIVTPASLVSLAALARSSRQQTSVASTGTPTSTPPSGPSEDLFSPPIIRPITNMNEHSIVNDLDDGFSPLDQTRAPLLAGFDQASHSTEIAHASTSQRSLELDEQDHVQSSTMGVIPEIAEAELRFPTQHESADDRQPTRLPTLLDVLRRTLGTVREPIPPNVVTVTNDPIQSAETNDISDEEENMSFFQRIGLTSRRMSRNRQSSSAVNSDAPSENSVHD